MLIKIQSAEKKLIVNLPPGESSTQRFSLPQGCQVGAGGVNRFAPRGSPI
jgi:hypothetical protein